MYVVAVFAGLLEWVAMGFMLAIWPLAVRVVASFAFGLIVFFAVIMGARSGLTG